MGPRVEIDLNVRVRGTGTYTGLENVYGGPVQPDDYVTVFESETGVEGNGRVTEVDHERRLVYLVVDWASMSEPEGGDAAGLAAFLTSARLSVGGGAATSTNSPMATEAPVACTA